MTVDIQHTHTHTHARTHTRTHTQTHARTPLDGRDARLAGVLLLLQLPDGVADVVLWFLEVVVGCVSPNQHATW